MVVMEWSQVRFPLGAAGEFSSFYADSCFGIRSTPRYRSSKYKISVIMPKAKVEGYS